MIGNSLTNRWLDMDLRKGKIYGYVNIEKLLQTFSGDEKRNILFTNFFQKLYPPLVCIIGQFQSGLNSIFTK